MSQYYATVEYVLAKAALLLVFVREMSGSNLGWDADYAE
jgi:hypothetical protein